MFCSKCGNQIADGSAFCPSCGNQLNVTPVAPVEPAAPVVEAAAPVVEPAAPVVEPAAPVVEPAAPAVEPVAPVEPVMPAQPAQPAEPVAPFAAAPVMPAQPEANRPKKSKAPLIIGIVAAVLVVAIVAIILVLVLGGDDEKPASGKEQEKTTAGQEVTTEEPTEEPTEEQATNKPSSDEYDLDDAEDVVDKFLTALTEEEFEDAADYMIPTLLEAYEESFDDMEMEEIMSLLSLGFVDNDFEYLEFEVVGSEEEDGSLYDDEYDDVVKNYPSYKYPDAFAMVEVEFDVYGEDVSGYLYVLGIDGTWYVCDNNMEDVDAALEAAADDDSTDPTDDPTDDVTEYTEDDIRTMLQQNSQSVDGDCDGTRVQCDGYSIVVPEGWNYDDSTGELSAATADKTLQYQVKIVEAEADDEKMVTYLNAVLNSLLAMGMEDVECGTLVANSLNGYYTKYALEADTASAEAVQFIFANDGKLYVITMAAESTTTGDPDDLLYAGASILFE